MRSRCVFKLLIAMLIALTATVESDARRRLVVYATVVTDTTAVLCQGPLEGYQPYIYRHIPNGEKVQVRDISRYKSGWVKVKYITPSYGIIKGYLPVSQLSRDGDYVELYKATHSKVNIAFRAMVTFFIDAFLTIKTIIVNIKAFYGRVFISAKESPASAWMWTLIALACTALLFRCLRSFDKNFKKPVIHYLLYVLTIVSVWGFMSFSYEHGHDYTFKENLLLFMMTMIPAFIAINAGWGVRQCGLIKGKYWKNSNYECGQILLFPVWIMVTVSFWFTFIYPVVEFTRNLESQDGTFWRSVIGLAVWICGTTAVLWAWVNHIVPRFFRTAGNWPLRIMTIVLWWAMLKFGYYWVYANFNGLAFIVVEFIGIFLLIPVLYLFLELMVEVRCPTCHDCLGRQTGREELGVEVTKKIRYRSINASDVEPERSDAVIEDPEEKVEYTTYTHKWNTEHTCPTCGTRWIVNHAADVETHERILERRHTERYIE